MTERRRGCSTVFRHCGAEWAFRRPMIDMNDGCLLPEGRRIPKYRDAGDSRLNKRASTAGAGRGT